jgi:GTP-binding protein
MSTESFRLDIRNIAIIAHVDHGKTTLVDHLLRQSGTFRENQAVVERIMDSNDLEREKGITIMAKNAAVRWGDIKINIVDTPGHSDFGGEVERILSMVDGVLLLVDAAEGPLPQTRFVLKKALELNLIPIVVINKIDRSDARAPEVLDEILELFIALGADYHQLDFPVIYAIAKQGKSTLSLDTPAETLAPLLETIISTIPPPKFEPAKPFQMIITALGWSDYIGRIAIGRIQTGSVAMGDSVVLIRPDKSIEQQRITKMYAYEGVHRAEILEASAGEIIALSGFENVHIGDTISDPSCTEPLAYVNIEEPTIAMEFSVNNSPFAGREGKHVTTPKIRERLFRELRTNVALRVAETDSPDTFKVSGRGELQLAILIETMRREGYEFAVSKPEVLFKRNEDNKLLEPIEHVIVDVPDAHIGTVIEILGRRKGEMVNMMPTGDVIRAEFYVPARGLIGFRTEFLTETRGTGLLHHVFDGYEAWHGELRTRSTGSLVSDRLGVVTSYALYGTQDRGSIFVEPGDEVYEGMVIGENSRSEDMDVNCVREKKLTNMRASGTDESERLIPAKKLNMEGALEFCREDECVEVTPAVVRIRKVILDGSIRARNTSKAKRANENS